MKNQEQLRKTITEIKKQLDYLTSLLEPEPSKPVGRLRFLEPDKRDDGVISYGNGRMLHPED